MKQGTLAKQIKCDAENKSLRKVKKDWYESLYHKIPNELRPEYAGWYGGSGHISEKQFDKE